MKRSIYAKSMAQICSACVHIFVIIESSVDSSSALFLEILPWKVNGGNTNGRVQKQLPRRKIVLVKVRNLLNKLGLSCVKFTF